MSDDKGETGGGRGADRADKERREGQHGGERDGGMEDVR